MGSIESLTRLQARSLRLDCTILYCFSRKILGPLPHDNLINTSLSVADWINNSRRQAVTVIGITGAQGSGKSTLALALSQVLAERHGLRVALVSLDDLYLTRAERSRQAAMIHPLLITRGVPGTHDTVLARQLLDSLRAAQASSQIAFPSFDKAVDDRRPASESPVYQGRADVVLFEGWCVGALPLPDRELGQPINTLESSEDPDGTWRRYVNHRLRTDYAELFSRLDRLIMLSVPDMDCVYRWRSEQEFKLRAAASTRPDSRIMDSREIRRFIMHFERMTRAMLEEMPRRADRVLYLDQQHCFVQHGVNSTS